MKKWGIGWAILMGFLLIAVVLAAIAAASYSRLIRVNERVSQQWSQVENVYKLRTDLISNLVSTVSGAATFDRSALETIGRAQALVGEVNVSSSVPPNDSSKIAKFDRVQSQVSSALVDLLAAAKRYPDLEAAQNFHDLRAELENIENRVEAERKKYNQAVQACNAAIRSFPTVLYARLFGFTDLPDFPTAPVVGTPK